MHMPSCRPQHAAPRDASSWPCAAALCGASLTSRNTIMALPNAVSCHSGRMPPRRGGVVARVRAAGGAGRARRCGAGVGVGGAGQFSDAGAGSCAKLSWLSRSSSNHAAAEG